MDHWIAGAMLVAMLGIAAQPAAADAPIAAMEQVQLSVYGTPPQGSQGVKRKGDQVVFLESLETLSESRALVRFIDGSGLALGAKSKVLIDEFVFDPDKTKGNAVLNISLGTLRFVTGAMPKGGIVIETPTATMTLRGTDVSVHVHPSGRTDILVHEGLVDSHNKFTGQDTTLSPGQSQTDTELGTFDFDGDFTQYGLNEGITSITVAEAAILINDVETAAGSGDSGDSSGGGKSHGKSGEKGTGNSGGGGSNGSGGGGGGSSGGNGGGKGGGKGK